MATLTVQDITLSGLELTTESAASGGDVFANPSDKRTFFYINNGSGSDMTLTVTAQGTSVNKEGFGTVSIADTTVTVTAGEARYVGPFPASRFNNSSGQVAVSYSDNTSVTVAAVRMPK